MGFECSHDLSHSARVGINNARTFTSLYNFMVQFLGREIFICIVIVVVVVFMISVIIVTGIEEIRMKVAKIFRLAEAGPVQSLSFFFISAYLLFHLVHL